jgi:hypothetical protein
MLLPPPTFPILIILLNTCRGLYNIPDSRGLEPSPCRYGAVFATEDNITYPLGSSTHRDTMSFLRRQLVSVNIPEHF